MSKLFLIPINWYILLIKIHDKLSAQLVNQSGMLKSNILAFSNLLQNDKLVLEDAAENLDLNLDRIKKASSRLGKLNLATRNGSCMIIAIILMVCIVSVFVFIIMRMFGPVRD